MGEEVGAFRAVADPSQPRTAGKNATSGNGWLWTASQRRKQGMLASHAMTLFSRIDCSGVHSRRSTEEVAEIRCAWCLLRSFGGGTPPPELFALCSRPTWSCYYPHVLVRQRQDQGADTQSRGGVPGPRRGLWSCHALLPPRPGCNCSIFSTAAGTRIGAAQTGAFQASCSPRKPTRGAEEGTVAARARLHLCRRRQPSGRRCNMPN